MDSDEEDFVFYGTPIEREEDVTSRKKKAVAEASGQLRTLPPWKQEVTDEEGRRRFHGAFTGGFSAGYYNTVGSKEGWTPQTFTSSRKNRAGIKQQSIYSFLDEDEKVELEDHSLGMSMQFDTFGFTAAELARKQADKEQQQRPSAIPGPVPDELVVPTTESIGVRLLLKMGWRHGRSIKDSNSDALYDTRREARKAFLAFSSDNTVSQLGEGSARSGHDLPTDDDNQFSKSTPAYVLNPKQDMYGLGFDPFKNAPEFREKKRLRISGNREKDLYRPLSIKGKVAPGFGIGALEDLDAEDEDIYTSGYDFEETFVHEIEEPSRPNVENMLLLEGKEHGVMPGFKVASKSDSRLERFDPPEIPKDFVPQHKFPAPLEIGSKSADDPPPEVPPPEDNNLKVLIEGVATLVARCGKLFENLSREKNQSNPLFAFLHGGDGCDFYARKLWEECQKRGNQTKLWDGKTFQNSQKLTAERRGKVLGEKALQRSTEDSSSVVASADAINLQFNLSDTFTKPASLKEVQEIAKPFSDNPAKQKRFEQFLKEKYRGGLRTKDSGGSSEMSEAARARERLEFESAAVAIENEKLDKESQATSQLLKDLTAAAGLQFTTGGVEKAEVQQDEELISKTMYPKREEFQWRPSPILCKRFDLTDPYMGKPPPAPRVRSKMDSLIFMPDSIKAANMEERVSTEGPSSLAPKVHGKEKGQEKVEQEVEVEVEVENVERPVDLYKAIFSDDSDDEEEKNAGPNQVENPQKKIEAANTALNRLMAGDFLESLGKELGLAVPPDTPLSENKAGVQPAQKETVDANKANDEYKQSITQNAISGSSASQKIGEDRAFDLKITQEGRFGNFETSNFDTHGNSSRMTDDGLVGKVAKEDRNASTPKHHNFSRSSSEDERTRKHSRSHRHRDISSDSDTSDISDDYRDRYRSRSKRKKKGSSREKSRSRRHSKHHKHRSRDSTTRSRRVSEKEREDTKRTKREYRE
ncbi:G patch domain-containing protein TGH [Abeliophyllum distichum]|uniref:G patch domain-containing protein TGH n=1 Tax=Abeliophyllum distichum TaxID=126358 RepID=A0ABD1Q1T2_9LAMI